MNKETTNYEQFEPGDGERRVRPEENTPTQISAAEELLKEELGHAYGSLHRLMYIAPTLRAMEKYAEKFASAKINNYEANAEHWKVQYHESCSRITDLEIQRKSLEGQTAKKDKRIYDLTYLNDELYVKIEDRDKEIEALKHRVYKLENVNSINKNTIIRRGEKLTANEREIEGLNAKITETEKQLLRLQEIENFIDENLYKDQVGSIYTFNDDFLERLHYKMQIK